MLPAAYRLKIPTSWGKSNPDFQIKTEYFKVIGKKVASIKTAKIGFIISGKVGKATVRNRIRRKISGLLQSNLQKLNSNKELIWVVYPSINQASNEEISTAVSKVLSKLDF